MLQYKFMATQYLISSGDKGRSAIVERIQSWSMLWGEAVNQRQAQSMQNVIYEDARPPGYVGQPYDERLSWRTTRLMYTADNS